MSLYDYAPEEIRTLPFNAKRPHLYPPNLPTTSQAMEDALEGRYASAYLPQRMTFQGRWNKGPAAIGYAENVVGALQAAAMPVDFVDGIVNPIEAGKGIYTPAMASRDFTRLPQPWDNMYMQKDPVTRGLLERPIVQAGSLNAYSAAGSTLRTTPDVTSETLLSTALEGDATPPLTSIGLGRIRRGARGHAVRTLKRGTGGLGGFTDAQGTAAVVYGVAGTAGLGLGIYHGWKRTHSVGWTVVWALAGAWFPVITIPVMFIQGFGKKG